MKPWVIATHNQGKFRELKALIHPIQGLSCTDFSIEPVEETGLTFIENALLKARHASKHAGYPALADDSGLVVPALQGQPGIRSARFAHPNAHDAENIEALLKLMEACDDRRAFFYCVLVFLQHPEDPAPMIATGQWHGNILKHPCGEAGFGYDPIFFVKTHQCTAAQLSIEEKNRISHRALAFKHLHEQCTTTYAF